MILGSVNVPEIAPSKEDSFLLNEDSIAQINLYDAAANGTDSRKQLNLDSCDENTGADNAATVQRHHGRNGTFDSRNAVAGIGTVTDSGFQDQDSSIFKVSSEVIGATGANIAADYVGMSKDFQIYEREASDGRDLKALQFNTNEIGNTQSR